MKLQFDTISYHLDEATAYLKKILGKCKNKKMYDGEFLPEIEHILSHLNFSYNARYLSRKKVSELSQAEYEQYTLPPKEIFKSLYAPKKIREQKKKTIKSRS